MKGIRKIVVNECRECETEPIIYSKKKKWVVECPECGTGVFGNKTADEIKKLWNRINPRKTIPKDLSANLPQKSTLDIALFYIHLRNKSLSYVAHDLQMTVESLEKHLEENKDTEVYKSLVEKYTKERQMRDEIIESRKSKELKHGRSRYDEG